MKNAVALSIIVLILFAIPANAQKNYLKIYPGYAFSAAKDVLESEFTSTSQKSIINSFGAGFNAGVAYGHMFNDNVGLEIGVSYIHTKETTVSDLELSIGSNFTKNTATVSSNQGRLAPTMIVTSNRDGVNFYTRAGIFMPFTGLLEFDNVSLSDTTGNGQFDQETFQKKQIKGQFSLGFSAAAGIDVKIKERLSIYAEAEMINLRVKYKTAEIVEFTRDGVDLTQGKDVWELEKNYVTELTASSNNDTFNSDFDPDQPEDLLIENGPFSSLGINVGVKLMLGKSDE